MEGQYYIMAINPSVFLEYSLSNPEVWLMLVGQKLTHNIFGSGTIKEIRLGDSVISNSLAIIQLDHPVNSIGSGLTDVKKLGLQAFNGQIITELSLPDELIEELKMFERGKIERELERQRQEAERIRTQTN